MNKTRLQAVLKRGLPWVGVHHGQLVVSSVHPFLLVLTCLGWPSIKKNYIAPKSSKNNV